MKRGPVTVTHAHRLEPLARGPHAAFLILQSGSSRWAFSCLATSCSCLFKSPISRFPSSRRASSAFATLKSPLSASTVPFTRAALFHALRRHNPGPGLVFHSDHAIEYTVHAYRAIMRSQGSVQSMIRPGQMSDDAHVKSFFRSLKSECIHDRRFDADEQLQKTLRTYFSFYDRTRSHTSLSRGPRLPSSQPSTDNHASTLSTHVSAQKSRFLLAPLM